MKLSNFRKAIETIERFRLLDKDKSYDVEITLKTGAEYIGGWECVGSAIFGELLKISITDHSTLYVEVADIVTVRLKT